MKPYRPTNSDQPGKAYGVDKATKEIDYHEVYRTSLKEKGYNIVSEIQSGDQIVFNLEKDGAGHTIVNNTRGIEYKAILYLLRK